MSNVVALQKFLDQSLSSEDAVRVERWLNNRPERWEALAKAADDPEIVDRIRNHMPAVYYQDEPDLKRALNSAMTVAGLHSGTAVLPTGQSSPVHEIELPGYRVIRKLGSGGMGAVFEAEHELLQQRVAIKVMSGQIANEASATERFFAEMKAIGKMDHPNLVRGLDARRHDGKLYLVMEYLEAEDLGSYRKRTGKLPLAHICDIIRQVGMGLAHAHQKGVIHRDIKPSNLMINAEGVVKILDLGLARFESAIDGGLTGDQVIVGTPDYISPEQIETPRDVDARADIYCLGCTFYFLLTGLSPVHDRSDALGKLVAHVNEPHDLPPNVIETIPEGLTQTIRKMLARDRNERFPDAMSVVQAVQPFCDSSNVAGSIGRDAQPAERVEPERVEPEPSFASIEPDDPSRVRAESDARSQEQPFSIQTKKPRPSAKRRRSKSAPVMLWIAAGLIGAILVAASVSLWIRTEDGTIQLQFANHATLKALDVRKDGVVSITDPTDGKSVRVEIDRDEQSLRLSKDGFEILTQSFQLDVGNQTIEIAFEPLAAPTQDAQAQTGTDKQEPAPEDTAVNQGPPETGLADNQDPAELGLAVNQDPPPQDPAMNAVAADQARANPEDAGNKKGRVADAYAGGKWVIDRAKNEIVQTLQPQNGSLLLFGDPSWTDYDFSFESNLPQQDQLNGFGGLFHVQSDQHFLCFGVGLYQNTWSDVSGLLDGQWRRSPGMAKRKGIRPDRWNKVRIEVRGKTVKCYLDDTLLFTSVEPQYTSGRCGLATRDRIVRFRNLRVTRPDGRVLWEGLPDSIEEK